MAVGEIFHTKTEGHRAFRCHHEGVAGTEIVGRPVRNPQGVLDIDPLMARMGDTPRQGQPLHEGNVILQISVDRVTGNPDGPVADIVPLDLLGLDEGTAPVEAQPVNDLAIDVQLDALVALPATSLEYLFRPIILDQPCRPVQPVEGQGRTETANVIFPANFILDGPCG